MSDEMYEVMRNSCSPNDLRQGLSGEIDQLEKLADQCRAKQVGHEILLRAIIEISNKCQCDCLYCGLRRSNSELRRYHLDEEAILAAAQAATNAGFSTIILQSGESSILEPKRVASLIERLRLRTTATIALSLGEWPTAVYARWHDAGAERYLLKFETANPQLFAQLRPGHSLAARLLCLTELRRLGFQVGSGNMVGLPGQTIEDLVDDLLLMSQLDLEMVAIGPFIPHPHTPSAESESAPRDPRSITLLTWRCISLARLLLPRANIPATTALESLAGGGRLAALCLGANVWMHDVTPNPWRKLYQIYPNRPVSQETPEQSFSRLNQMFAALGRRGL